MADKRIPGLNLANPFHFFAFGFGSGLMPRAPGTWGTLAAVPLYLLIQDWILLHYLPLVILLAVLGFWICDVAAIDLKVHDHPAIVWDEIVGFLITMIAAPAGWGWIVLGFVLFRLFDILKPWPIGWVDSKVKGGFGIMLDDILAGLMALGCLQLLAYLLI